MKIQSKLNHNLGLNLPHSKSGGVPGRIQIPAGATMEFSDEEWEKYRDAANNAIQSGGLIILELTKSDAKKREDRKLADAQKLVESNKKKDNLKDKLKGS